MSIGIPLTEAERMALKTSVRGGRLSPESAEALSLPVGADLKFPCRWKHYHNNSCAGTTLVTRAFKRHGMMAQTTCRNGYLYVLRVK